MKKKLLATLVLAVLLLSLIGCTDNSKKTFDKIVQIELPQQTYIRDLKVGGAYWDRYAYNAAGTLKDYYGPDYQRASDRNLNCDCGTTTDCMYLYESRTVNKFQAITNVTFINREDAPAYYVDENGAVYYAVGGVRINGLNSSKTRYDMYDLNKGAGGSYIYLYATTDRQYQPITGLCIITDISTADSKYSFIYNTNGQLQNLNEGAGGDYLFLGISRAVTGWEMHSLVLTDHTIGGRETSSTFIAETVDQKIKESWLEPFLDKGTGAHFLGYCYSNSGETVKAGDVLKYDTEAFAVWRYDITLDMSSVNQDNIVYSNIKSIYNMPTLSKDGYDFLGWYYKGTDIRQENNVTVYRGGTLEPRFRNIHPTTFSGFCDVLEFVDRYTEEQFLNLLRIMNPNNYNTPYGNGYHLGWITAAYLRGYRVVPYSGAVPLEEDPLAPVTTELDISSLSDSEKTVLQNYSYFFLCCANSDIVYTLNYYLNDNPTTYSALANEAILDLANKELARRGYTYDNGQLTAQ